MSQFQTHFRDRALSEYSDARLIASTQPDGTAIVFIHGYGGDCIETWSDFHRLLPIHPKAAGCDLLFYGYDGLRADLVASAGLFETFLNDLLSRTSILLNATVPFSAVRPLDFAYDKVTLVAHSLGAVILRWALLDAMARHREWLQNDRIRFVLYAPAHTGANISALATELLGSISFLRYFWGAARFVSPLIDQLRYDSDYLKRLESGTKTAIASVGEVSYLRPAAVVIAEEENIVRNLPFGSDGPAEVIRGTNHFSVCKPRSDFLKPLSFVLAQL